MTAAATDRAAQPAGDPRPARWGVGATAMVALAAFMVVLTLLAIQLRTNPASLGLVAARSRVVVVRRIYQTTVHERIIGATGSPGAATTVSSSSVGVSSPPAAGAPVSTRTS